jgi:hypothetical protein
MIWLQRHELADELEDACLAGDSKLSILASLETDSVLRWFQSSAYNELVYKLCLMDSNERMTTYFRQYAKVVSELMVLNNTITSVRLATLKSQQQDLEIRMLGAAEACGELEVRPEV